MAVILKSGRDFGIIASKDWSELAHVRRILGPADVPGSNERDRSHLLIAKIAEIDDRGIWIELNPKTFTDQRVRFLMVPWHCILSVISTPESESTSRIGFSLASDSDPGETTTHLSRPADGSGPKVVLVHDLEPRASWT